MPADPTNLQGLSGCAEFLRLVYFDGLSKGEVTVVLGKRTTAVRARLCRARRTLRDRLDDGGSENPLGTYG